MTLAVLGATGYTGRLVLDEARRAGLPLRLVGRRREALDALARPGEEVRVADARDEQALAAAFDGATVVASTAGPFLELGFAPVAAAIAAGAHYLDSTGEQRFVHLVHEQFGAEAAARGVVVIPSFGFDYVPGDLAARLAAEQVEGGLDEVVVAYSVKGVGTTRGTRRTLAAVMEQGQLDLAGRPARSVPLRRDHAQRPLPLRRAHRRRVGRGRALDGAPPYRRSQRSLLPPSPCSGGARRPRRHVGRSTPAPEHAGRPGRTA